MEEGARLRCCPAAKAVSEKKKPRDVALKTHINLTSRCLVVLRQSGRRSEVKSSGLAKRALILTVFCTFRGGKGEGREPLRRGLQRPSGCVSCVSRTRAFAFATCQNILRDGNTWLVFTPAAECFVQTAKTLSVYGLAVRYPPTARSEVVLQFGMLCSSR